MLHSRIEKSVIATGATWRAGAFVLLGAVALVGCTGDIDEPDPGAAHVHGARWDNGTPITQWDCINQPNVLWWFDPVGH